MRGRALVEVVREACLLALVEVLPAGVRFVGRAAGIAPFSVVDDYAREAVSFAGEVGVGLAGWQGRFGCAGRRLVVRPLAAFATGSVAVSSVVADEVL